MNRMVNDVVKNNLCVGCGVCQSVCPCHAIQYNYARGLYYPHIDEEKCIQCGACFQLCPGKGFDYKELYTNIKRSIPHDLFVGDHIVCKIAKTYDKEILTKAASGGIATTIVKMLLDSGVYDAAFCVTSYNYSSKVNTCRIDKDNDFSNVTKSRYIPVSQSEAIEYIIKNRDKKVILIGVSCFIQAVNEVILKYNLDRTKILLIGLFCERNYNYNIEKYFKYKIDSKSPIQKLYFKTKEKSGWPGDVKVILEDQSVYFFNKKERIKIKDFYQMERCLYCLDKLNQFADISLGDNYTKFHQDKEGTSCVIVRTNLGEKILSLAKSKLEMYDIDISEIANSQGIEERKENLQNIIQKKDLLDERKSFNIKKTVSDGEKKEYKKKKKWLRMGEMNRIGHINLIIWTRESRGRSFFLNLKFKLHDYKVKLFTQDKG